MKKIWAVVSYFDEEYYIMQSLISIAPFVDGFILVDGAYYGTKPTFSSDNTNELIGLFARTFGEGKEFKWYCSYDVFPNLVHEHFEVHRKITEKGWESEMEKRQFAIDRVPLGDIMLIHDADELALGDPIFFRKEIEEQDALACNTISIEHCCMGDWWSVPRVLERVEEMTYGKNHWIIKYEEGTQNSLPANKGYLFRYFAQVNMGDFYRPPRQAILKIESKGERGKKEDDPEKIKAEMRKKILDAQRVRYEKYGYPLDELIEHREKIIGDKVWSKHYQTEN